MDNEKDRSKRKDEYSKDGEELSYEHSQSRAHDG